MLRRLRKAAKHGDLSFAPYALGLEIGLYGWLIDGLFQGDQEADPAYWFMVLAIVMTRLYHQKVLLHVDPVPARASVFGAYPNRVWVAPRTRALN